MDKDDTKKVVKKSTRTKKDTSKKINELNETVKKTVKSDIDNVVKEIKETAIKEVEDLTNKQKCKWMYIINELHSETTLLSVEIKAKIYTINRRNKK